MLGLVPVGSAPIGILSLNIRNVANRDVEVDGWRSGATGALEAGNIAIDSTQNLLTAYSTTHSLTIPAPKPLQTLVFFIANNTFPTVTISTITDTGGGTWVLDAAFNYATFGFYRRIGGSTTGNITVSWTSSDLLVGQVRTFYLTGASQNLVVDSTYSSSFGFTSNITTGITTTSNNALIIAAIGRGGAGSSYVITTTSAGTERLNLGSDSALTQLLIKRNAGTAGPTTLSGTWEASAGTLTIVAYRPVQINAVLADSLDEDTPDNSDYSYSSNLDDRQTPLVMALNNPLEAGTYTFNFTAQKDLEWGQVKLTLLDSNLTSVGASSWTGLVDRTFNTYSVTATTTATSAFIKVEARSDAAVVLDFTDQDKTPKGLSIYNSNYFSSFGRNGLYLDKYGYLRTNEINLVNNDTNISSWVNSTALSSYILNQDYSPENTYTAAKLVESNSSGIHALTSTPIYSIAIGTTYTRSIYLKPAGRSVCKLEDGLTTAHSAVFVLSGIGSVQSATNLVKSSINSVENGWYRCSITYTNSGNTETWLKLTLQSTTSTNSYLGDGTSGIFFWGNQLERGWNLTPYTNNPYTEVNHGGGSHRLRIHHNPTDYYYVGNEVEPPRAWLASLSQSGNYTYFSGNVTPNTIVNGSELIIQNAGSTNSYYGIQFTRTTTAGLPYSLETGGRKIDSTNVFLRIDGPTNNRGTRASVNALNTTSISVINKSTFRATSNSITYLLYHDGNSGTSSAYTTVSLREVRHKPLGLLVECYTQNELLYSTDLSNTSVWTRNLVELDTSSPKVSPSGSIDSFYFNAGTSAGGHSLQQNINFTAGSTYIFSVYCDGQVQLRVDDAVGGFYANFLNLSSFAPIVSGSSAGLTTIMEPQGNGWTRVAIKFVATASGTFPVFINIITGSGAAKNQSFTNAGALVRLWGPMLQTSNIGAYTRPSSYIATGASIGANSNDFYRYNIGDIYNAGAPFSIYLEAGGFNQTYGYFLSLTAGEGGNFWSIDYTSTNELRLLHYLPSYLYPVLTTTTGSVTPSSVNTIAARFESGNFAVSVNGVLFTSTNIVDPIPGVNLLQLCWMGDNNFGGYIRRVKYYPRALSDGELLTLAGTDPDQNAGVNLLTTSW